MCLKGCSKIQRKGRTSECEGDRNQNRSWKWQGWRPFSETLRAADSAENLCFHVSIHFLYLGRECPIGRPDSASLPLDSQAVPRRRGARAGGRPVTATAPAPPRPARTVPGELVLGLQAHAAGFLHFWYFTVMSSSGLHSVPAVCRGKTELQV